jgi:hypothetical protein
VRWLSLVAGGALLAIAFGAGTRVADTREGLIAEVITLLAGLAGISLVLYGLFAGARPAPKRAPFIPPPTAAPRPARDLALGAGGLGLAVVLVGGLARSAGWQWALLSLVMLLPMIAGSGYLFARFLRTRSSGSGP